VELTSWRLGSGQEIVCIADNPFSQENHRLIIGTRDKMVQVMDIDPKGQLIPHFSVTLDKTVPKGVVFADNADDVYVFGLFDGDV